MEEGVYFYEETANLNVYLQWKSLSKGTTGFCFTAGLQTKGASEIAASGT